MSSPAFRWVVAGTQPLGLAELLARHGLQQALVQRRVFVNGQRAEARASGLCEGDVVEVFAPRPGSYIQVLYQSRGVVAVSKPAPLPTEPDHAGADSVLEQLAELLGAPRSELHAVSRLDVGVSGVLLVALDNSSRAELLLLREQGRLRRRYVALAAGAPEAAEGEWNESLAAGGRRKQTASGPGARAAQTRYRLVGSARSVAAGGPGTSLLALSPVTGRTHQLRVHAAAHAAPLLGDRKYGGPARRTAPDGSVQAFSQIMLHSAWVEWGHHDQVERVTTEPCAALVEVWLSLAGDPVALQRALD